MKFAPVTLALGLGVAMLGPVAGVTSASSAVAAGTQPVAQRVTQTGSTSLTPPIVQPGPTAASADEAKLSGTVTFTPIRKGRPVVIERMLPGGQWSAVATLQQDRRGAVSFTGPAKSGKQWYSYRGVAKKYDGLPRFYATPKSAQVWGAADFKDQFTGKVLNSDSWSYRAVGEYAPESDRACSASSEDAVKVGGGRVSLSVLKDKARGEDPGLLGDGGVGPCNKSWGNTHPDRGWYKNGHVSTNNRYSFKYGFAAARMKFDQNVGAHGSFWLQSTVSNRAAYGPDADGAEIDTVEYFGKAFKQGDIYSFVHYKVKGTDADVKVPDVPVTAARRALGAGDDWFKSYHVFSVEWTPRSYVFRVDGIKTLTIREGVSKVPEFLILSMLSSGWELEKLDKTTLPNTTEVDWVQVWEG